MTDWSTSNRAPGRYRKGDCPIAEAMADVEFQVGGNYYLDGPELMSQIAAALRKVGENAAALRSHFDAKRDPRRAG